MKYNPYQFRYWQQQKRQETLESIRQQLYPRAMATDKAKKKAEIVHFFEKYGLDATTAAFKVSKTSVYRWRQVLQAHNGGIASLNETSTVPHTKRQRTVAPELKEEIVKLRRKYPRLGKAKLQPLLGRGISVSTVGRLIAELKGNGRLPSEKRVALSAKTGKLFEKECIQPRKAKLRAKGYRVEKPGDLVQVDAVVKFVNGLRRYVLTAIDCQGSFAFAYGYTSLSSRTAKDFFGKLVLVSPFTIRAIQTDNGSEFHREFRDTVEQAGIPQFFIYPRRPRMNAKVERFNRTIQEEFLDHHLDSLLYDPPNFNQQLVDWLLWYNTERPHYALKQVSPIQHLIHHHGFSQMLWTHTWS